MDVGLPLAPDATFGRYAIEALIGRGGMGEVYRARDKQLDRRVALKVLRTDRDTGDDVSGTGSVARLLREARAAAAFNHANSVSLYELGEAEGIPYIAMEFVTGSSLRAYLHDAVVSTETKTSWLIDAARALWAAHKAGLVHRDVKPSNIMVSDEGVVKVLDFGLAKAVTKIGPGDFQTLGGQVLGTPRYMAPEQLEGHPADARADQFAFGVTAYELLSGIHPGGPLAGAPTALDAVSPHLPAELSRAVLRMMSRDPSARFDTMEDAAHALRMALPAVRAMRPPTSSAALPTLRRAVEEPPSDPSLEETESSAIPGGASVAPTASTLPLGAAPPVPLLAPVAAPSFDKTLPLASASASASGRPAAPTRDPRFDASSLAAPPSALLSRGWTRLLVGMAVAGILVGALAAWATR